MNRPKTSQYDIRFVAQASGRLTQFMVQFVQIVTTQIFHLNLFQIAPDTFIWVQVRRVGRQPFQMDAFGRPLAQAVFDSPASMSGQTVPDNEQLATNVTKQMVQKADNRGPLESARLDHHEQAAIRGDGADDRQMIPGQGHPQDRRLPAGSIGAYSGGQQVKARFINKYYRSSSPLGFYLLP